jgi:hypothetical protein
MSTPLQSLPLATRIECFVELGKTLSALSWEEKSTLSLRAKGENPWFTEANTLMAFQSLCLMLDEEALVNFVLQYPQLKETKKPQTIALVLAGNIPAVGFHDVLCVLLSGECVQIKLSKSDTVLMKFLLDRIVSIEPSFSDFIQVVDRLTIFDKVICTGSDNSARYFEHYFGKYPHIIRKNRTSVAVLQGDETPQDLRGLADDIFSYYGFGCRNVSKLFLPSQYDIQTLIAAMEPYSEVVNHHKYANNYDYNRAIFLLNLEPFYDNGFVMLKEATSYFSPISVLHYGYYDSLEDLLQVLEKDQQSIQCIVSHIKQIKGRVNFGDTQRPGLLDYADGVDTLQFLLSPIPSKEDSN